MILVGGGTGFVGQAFCRALTRSGTEFTSFGRAQYPALATRHSSVVIWAAGSSSKLQAQRDPVEDFSRNVSTVRAAVHDFPTDLFVLISSCDVYPNVSDPGANAEDAAIDPALLSGYGFHKYLAEQCVRHAALHWLIVRAGGMVGPGLRKNAVFDILYGDRLWLDPRSELQYLHTAFLADAVLGMIALGVRDSVVNVAGNGVVSLQEVMDWTGRHVRVSPDSPRVRYEVNLAKLSRYMPIPSTRETVRSFVQTGESGGPC